MTRALLILAALAAGTAPAVCLCDPLPAPPSGERHLVVAPESQVTLADGTVVITDTDPLDPTFGGLYTPPALARWDLDRLRRLEAERDAAIARAEAQPPALNLRLAGVALGVGIAAGGTATAFVVDGKPGVKAAAAVGSALLGSLLIYLLR